MKKFLKLVVSFLLVFFFVGMIKAEGLGVDSITANLDMEVKYPGDFAYVNYIVTGENNDKTATVILSGNNSDRTKVTHEKYGWYLRIGTNETASSITVTAIANADNTVTDTIVINLQSPTIINEINLTYDTGSIPFMSSVTTNSFLDWIKSNYGTTTEHIQVENNGNVTLNYIASGEIHYIPESDNELGTTKEYAVLFAAHPTETSYAFPLNVRDLDWNSKVAVTTLDGFTVKVNGVVRNDVVICYNESWKDVMFYVPFGHAPQSYFVNFDSNGGSNVDGQTVLHNGYITEPEDPTREGYVFDHWYRDEELTERFYFDTPVVDYITLYAKWNKIIDEVNINVGIPEPGQTPQAPTIDINSNYTIGDFHWYLYESPYPHLEGTDTFEAGKVYSLRVTVVPKNGYALAYPADDKGPYYYINGVSTSCYGGPGNRELTFYLYNVTFNSNGGSEVSDQTVYASAKVIEPAKPTKEGFAFGGWYTDSEFTNKYDFSKPVTNSYTLYAKWITEATTPSISLAANNNKITLTWEEDAAAIKFEVYRSTDNKKWTKLGTVTTNSYVDKSLTYNKKYYYKVRSYDGTRWTSYSNIVNKTIKPNKVTNLKITSAGTNNIKLSWDKVSVTGYEVYRSTDNKKWSKVTTITKNSTLTYNNKKLSANKKYYYKVRAYKTVSGKKIYGSYSAVVYTRTAPVKPSVSLSYRDLHNMNLKIGSVKGASNYKVYKSTDGTNYELIEELPKDGTLAVEAEVGTTYYYRVRACNSYNRCSGLVTVSKKHTTKAPSVSLKTSSKKVTVKLNSVEGADAYEIYRATSKNGKYKLVKSIPSEDALTFVDSTKKGTTYYYKARTCRVVGGKNVYSSYSGVKSIRSK